MKILVIDDQPSRISIIASSDLKIDDFIVAHGWDQIDFYLKNYHFDLILLDHDMPLMSGGDVVSTFLIQRSIPVIIISNNFAGSQSMLSKLLEYGVDAIYLPITSPDLIRAEIKKRSIKNVVFFGF